MAGSDKKLPFNIYLLKYKVDDKGANQLREPKDFLARPLTGSGKPKLISYNHYPLTDGGKSLGDLYIRKPHSETKPDWVDLFEAYVEELT